VIPAGYSKAPDSDAGVGGLRVCVAVYRYAVRLYAFSSAAMSILCIRSMASITFLRRETEEKQNGNVKIW
jgi:hypothetical protein